MELANKNGQMAIPPLKNMTYTVVMWHPEGSITQPGFCMWLGEPRCGSMIGMMWLWLQLPLQYIYMRTTDAVHSRSLSVQRRCRLAEVNDGYTR